MNSNVAPEAEENEVLLAMTTGEVQEIEVSEHVTIEVIAVPNGWLFTRSQYFDPQTPKAVTTTFVPRPFKLQPLTVT